MAQIRSGGAPAAVLAGSLAVFPLLDVLALLARTGHVGELQVVADGVEAHLHVDNGNLIDRPSAASERLFELACLEDAWFTVSATGAASDGPARSDQRARVPLEPLLAEVAPHVAEWHALVKTLPFGAVARMSPAMPGPEAQIRSDQWRILSLIGTGRPVHEVVDVSDSRPLETLRLVDELAQKKLIVVDLPSAGARRAQPARSTASAASAGPAAAAASADPAASASAEPQGDTTGEHDAGADDTAGHEAAASARLDTARHDGSRHDGSRPSAGQPETTDPSTEPAEGARASGEESSPPADGGGTSRRLVAARGSTTPLIAKRAGTVRAPVPERPPRRGPGSHAVAAYMPPPVSPSFWPILEAAGDRHAAGTSAHRGGPTPEGAGNDASEAAGGASTQSSARSAGAADPATGIATDTALAGATGEAAASPGQPRPS